MTAPVVLPELALVVLHSEEGLEVPWRIICYIPQLPALIFGVHGLLMHPFRLQLFQVDVLSVGCVLLWHEVLLVLHRAPPLHHCADDAAAILGAQPLRSYLSLRLLVVQGVRILLSNVNYAHFLKGNYKYY